MYFQLLFGVLFYCNQLCLIHIYFTTLLCYLLLYVNRQDLTSAENHLRTDKNKGELHMHHPPLFLLSFILCYCFILYCLLPSVHAVVTADYANGFSVGYGRDFG